MLHLVDVLTWAAILDVGAVPQLPEWALHLADCLALCFPFCW